MRDLLIEVRKHVEAHDFEHTVVTHDSRHHVGFQCARCLGADGTWLIEHDHLGRWLRSCVSASHRQVIMMLFQSRDGRSHIADLLNSRPTFSDYLLIPFEKQAGRATTAPTIWERLDDDDPV